MISEHDFSLMGFVRVSAFVEHNQAFVGLKTRNEYSAREVVHFRFANRKNIISEDISRFDCKLINTKVYLNSEYYPYLNLDFDKNSTNSSVRHVRALQGLL